MRWDNIFYSSSFSQVLVWPPFGSKWIPRAADVPLINPKEKNLFQSAEVFLSYLLGIEGCVGPREWFKWLGKNTPCPFIQACVSGYFCVRLSYLPFSATKAYLKNPSVISDWYLLSLLDLFCFQYKTSKQELELSHQLEHFSRQRMLSGKRVSFAERHLNILISSLCHFVPVNGLCQCCRHSL